MTANFKNKLLRHIESKNVTRKELIALLQTQYYDSFKGLDSITLSRWSTGKSTPPLYKQLLVAKCLNINLMDFILGLELSELKIPHKHKAIKRALFKMLDFSLSNFTYINISGGVKSKIKSIDIDEYNKKFKGFYNNISPLSKFNDDIIRNFSKIEYKSIVIKNKNKLVVSHLNVIVDLDSLNGLPSFITIPKEELKQSCLTTVGYFTSSSNYLEIITTALSYYIISHASNKEYIYTFVGDVKPLLNFSTLVLNAEVVKYYPPKERGTMGVYLLKNNLIKLISNPALIKRVKEKLECLSNCNPDCNLCNLRDFRQAAVPINLMKQPH